MLDANDLLVIEEHLLSMEVTTQEISILLDGIEDDIQESTQRLRQEIILNRTTLINSLDRILCNLDELKKELQEG